MLPLMPRIKSWRAPLGGVLAAAVSLLLIVAYVWSRGGQTTRVRIEVNGDSVVTFVDGRPVHQAMLAGHLNGGIILFLPEWDRVPSLPTPRGIDKIKVSEAATGRTLFEDDFSRSPVTSGKWTAVEGQLIYDVGAVATGPDGGRLSLTAPNWRDYIVELTARNVAEIRIGVRAASPEDMILFTTTPFRHIDAFLGASDGTGFKGSSRSPLDFDKAATTKSIVAIFLQPLPLLALVLLGVICPAFLLSGVRLAPPQLHPNYARLLPHGVAVVTAGAAFVTSLILMVSVAGAVPHVPDELSYMFQGKLIASGDLAAEPPPVEQAFAWSTPSPIAVHDGKWASIYPFAYPALLAIGFVVGAPWLVNPLLGGVCCFLVYLVGRRIYRTETGLLAAILIAASPFFLMTASNYMSHTATAAFLLAALACLAYSTPARGPALAVLAGVFLGLAINSRPLTGALVVPAVVVFLLAGLREPSLRRECLRQALLFAAGLVAMLLLYFLYRYVTTGDAFTTEAVQTGRDSLGFGGKHSLAAGLSNEQTQTAYLMLVLHNWPLHLGAGLAILTFVLGGFRRWDVLLGLSALSIMAGYTLYFHNGLMHGPRFWFEAAPLLMLLSARGIELVVLRAQHAFEAAFHAATPFATRAALYGLYPVVALLALLGAYGWLFGSQPGWSADFVPNTADALRPFNGMDDRMEDAIEQAGILPNSLVLVDECSNWQCYGSVFWHNRPSLDGDVVYARLLPDEAQLAQLLAAFEDRYVYEADFNRGVIVPVTSSGSMQPLLARDVVVRSLLE
jgi:hypothetical protein